MKDNQKGKQKMSDLNNLKDKIATLKEGMKITQIAVSRVIKSRDGGDVFVSLTSNYDGELTLKDARLATHLLGLEVQTLALEEAVAGGTIARERLDGAKKALRNNFSKLIVDSEGGE